MTKLELMQAQRKVLSKQIDCFGELNKVGITCGYDTLQMEIARRAIKAAYLDIGDKITKWVDYLASDEAL